MNQISENEVNDQEQNFPNGFLQLYTVVKIDSACDGLALLLHAFLLEVGFIPKDVAVLDVYKCMPENWNSSGIFKVQYDHKDLPDISCWVTCVRLCGYLVIQGTPVNKQLEDNTVHMKLQVNSYVKAKEDISYPSKVFSHIQELRRVFRDGFCFPLLVLLQESVNYKPAFGLNGLIEEVKITILKLLPVESVVSLSAVNKNLHRQANSPYLWKCLFIRDYGPGDPSVVASPDEHFKDMYIMEYLKRKRIREFRPPPPVYSISFMQGMYAVGPNFNVDPRIASNNFGKESGMVRHSRRSLQSNSFSCSEISDRGSRSIISFNVSKSEDASDG